MEIDFDSGIPKLSFDVTHEKPVSHDSIEVSQAPDTQAGRCVWRFVLHKEGNESRSSVTYPLSFAMMSAKPVHFCVQVTAHFKKDFKVGTKVLKSDADDRVSELFHFIPINADKIDKVAAVAVATVIASEQKTTTFACLSLGDSQVGKTAFLNMVYYLLAPNGCRRVFMEGLSAGTRKGTSGVKMKEVTVGGNTIRVLDVEDHPWNPSNEIHRSHIDYLLRGPKIGPSLDPSSQERDNTPIKVCIITSATVIITNISALNSWGSLLSCGWASPAPQFDVPYLDRLGGLFSHVRTWENGKIQDDVYLVVTHVDDIPAFATDAFRAALNRIVPHSRRIELRYEVSVLGKAAPEGSGFYCEQSWHDVDQFVRAAGFTPLRTVDEIMLFKDDPGINH